MPMPRQDDTIFVLDGEALLRLWLINAVERQQMRADVAERLWTRQHHRPDFLLAYFSVADARALFAMLYRDLEDALGRAWLKTYNGDPHVVAKGSSRMRRLLVNPQFGGQPVKVVALAIGRTGIHPARGARAVTSLILLTREDIADPLLRDEAALTQAGLPAAAIMRAAGAGGIGAVAGTLASGAMVGTFAIDSLLVAAAVSAGANSALAWLDSRSTQVARMDRMLSDGGARFEAETARGRGWLGGLATILRQTPGQLVDLTPLSGHLPRARQLGRLNWRFVTQL